MQRYFFHLVSKEDLLVDHEGHELQSLFFARAYAVRLDIQVVRLPCARRY